VDVVELGRFRIARAHLLGRAGRVRRLARRRPWVAVLIVAAAAGFAALAVTSPSPPCTWKLAPSPTTREHMICVPVPVRGRG